MSQEGLKTEKAHPIDIYIFRCAFSVILNLYELQPLVDSGYRYKLTLQDAILKRYKYCFCKTRICTIRLV